MTQTLREFFAVIGTMVVIMVGAAVPQQLLSAEDKPPAAESDAQPRLTQQERGVITSALRGNPIGSVTVACAGQFCRRAAEDVADLFAGAGWRVSTIKHGGVGIDGVTGIMVNSCGMEGEKVASVLKQATARVVKSIDDGPCADGAAHEIYVVIGAAPF